MSGSHCSRCGQNKNANSLIALLCDRENITINTLKLIHNTTVDESDKEVILKDLLAVKQWARTCLNELGELDE